MIGGVVHGTFMNGPVDQLPCISRNVPAVSVSALSTYGTMNTGFSTIGSPKKIGSLIWNTCVGSERRLTLRNAWSRATTG
jgi:hypothetical protein